MINSSLLMLDEATEELAPVVRGKIWPRPGALKNAGQSILVIDKNLEIEKGRIVCSDTSLQLKADPSLKTRILGV